MRYLDSFGQQGKVQIDRPTDPWFLLHLDLCSFVWFLNIAILQLTYKRIRFSSPILRCLLTCLALVMVSKE